MSGLAGRRVLLTREEEDCAAWAAEIEGFGAVPVISLWCVDTLTTLLMNFNK